MTRTDPAKRERAALDVLELLPVPLGARPDVLRSRHRALVVYSSWTASRTVDASTPEGAAAPEKAAAPNVVDVAKSAVGIWSLVRALLVAIAVLVGYQITRDYDPYWVAIVVLVVFLPETDKATFKAFQRGTGTLAGALAGTALLAVTTSEPVILVAMLVAAFFTVVFYSANYTIYAFFLTAVIVFYEWFATGEQVSAGGQRLLAAVIGVALAIVGIGLMTRLRAAQTHLAD